MRNFFLVFSFFVSTSVYSIDNSFAPLQFPVGEEVIKPLIEGDANFSSVQWTTKSPQTITAIASGSNVLVPIVNSLDVALKKAAQNSTAGNTGSETVVATGNFVKATQAMSVAQSGVFIQAMFGLLDFSGGSLFLLNPTADGTLVSQTYFDSALLKLVSSQHLQDLRMLLGGKIFIPVVSLKSLVSSDVEQRENQFKAIGNYQCQGHPFIYTIRGGYGYCMPKQAKYFIFYSNKTPVSYESAKAQLETSLVKEGRSDFIYGYIGHERDDGSPDDPLKVFIAGDQSSSLSAHSFSSFYYCVLPNKYCPSTFVNYRLNLDSPNKGFTEFEIKPIENSSSKCPVGTIFHYPNSGWFGGLDIQVCTLDFSNDSVHSLYEGMTFSGNYPTFELYPDNKIKYHPVSLQNMKNHVQANYYPNVLIYGDQFLSYTKTLDQNISAVISFISLLSENAFLISRTVNGLKLLRNGNIEVSLIIRDILKFSNDFKLLERTFSFETQDGFDIAVGSTRLSPKTYGVLGKTIAEQFGIRTLGTEIILPDKNENTANESIPCGLGKEIDVLRTRKNAETGKDENYYVKEKSTPCLLNFGKAIKPSNIKVKGEPVGDQTKEEAEKELSDQISGFFDGVMTNFLYTSSDKSQKIVFFPTTDQCQPIEFDFRSIPLLKGEKKVFNQHCEEIAKNPAFQSTLRFASMIGWFFLALIRVLRA